MNKSQLIAVRNSFQTLLDNYQIVGTALEPFKNAMVDLNAVIDTPDDTPAAPAAAPAVSATAISEGVAQIMMPIFQRLADSMQIIGSGVQQLQADFSATAPASTPTTPPAAQPAAPAAQPAA